MELTRYRFLTTWRLDAPLAAAYEAIHAVEHWPEWWRGVQSVERLDGGDGDGIGSVYRHRWRSVRPYAIEFDVETTRRAARRARGRGARRPRRHGPLGVPRRRRGARHLRWDVHTTKPWMKAASPVARPVFICSHNTVMRWGGDSLAALLGARLLT